MTQSIREELTGPNILGRNEIGPKEFDPKLCLAAASTYPLLNYFVSNEEVYFRNRMSDNFVFNMS